MSILISATVSNGILQTVAVEYFYYSRHGSGGVVSTSHCQWTCWECSKTHCCLSEIFLTDNICTDKPLLTFAQCRHDDSHQKLFSIVQTWACHDVFIIHCHRHLEVCEEVSDNIVIISDSDTHKQPVGHLTRAWPEGEKLVHYRSQCYPHSCGIFHFPSLKRLMEETSGFCCLFKNVFNVEWINLLRFRNGQGDLNTGMTVWWSGHWPAHTWWLLSHGRVIFCRSAWLSSLPAMMILWLYYGRRMVSQAHRYTIQ